MIFKSVAQIQGFQILKLTLSRPPTAFRVCFKSPHCPPTGFRVITPSSKYGDMIYIWKEELFWLVLESKHNEILHMIGQKYE